VADLAGQDKLSLVGVIFVPAAATWGSAAANTSETHVLTITMSNNFDSATTNTVNAGNYVWAIRAGGEFRAGPTGTSACVSPTGAPVSCNTIGNSVTFPGTGTFSTTLTNRNILSPAGSAANTQPLSFTVAGPTNPIVSFNGLTNATLGQVNPTYPTFLCDFDGSGPLTACKPSITEVMTVTLKGPDSFVLVNGGDGSGASCAATLTATQQKQIALLTKLVTFLELWESRHHNTHLEAFIAQIRAFLAVVNTVDPNCGGATLVNLDFAVNAALDQVAFAASGAVPAEPVTTGTITITKNTSQATSATFNFNNTINETSSPIASISMDGQNTKTVVVTVDAGTYNLIESPLSGWTLDSSSCGDNGDPTAFGVVGVFVPVGGNVTCTFINNKAFISDDYRVNSSALTWTDARAAAQALAQTLGGVWDLATINSAAEQTFIQTLLPADPRELPGIHDYWIAGEQPNCTPEPGCNWRWATTGQVFYNGVPIAYANWGTTSSSSPYVGPANEPNNLDSVESNLESHVTLDNRYGWGWNDRDGVAHGYVAERVSP
jgi:hypothetical protein